MSINRDVLASAQCADAFRQIRWSLLFFCFNIHIGVDGLRINLIPSILGWIMVSSALSAIANLSPKLLSIKKLTSWLTVLSLFEIVQERLVIGTFRGIDLWVNHIPVIGILGSVPISIGSYILTTMLIWKLCELIEEIATVGRDNKVKNQASQYKRTYVVATFLGATVMALTAALLPPPLVFVMLLAYIVAAVALTIRLLISTEQMCRRYADRYSSFFNEATNL